MLLIEAQIRGMGRVALKVVTVTLKYFLLGVFLGKSTHRAHHQHSRDFGHSKNIQLWAGIETSKVDLR
jgi:hypothetical protein